MRKGGERAELLEQKEKPRYCGVCLQELGDIIGAGPRGVLSKRCEYYLTIG